MNIEQRKKAIEDILKNAQDAGLSISNNKEKAKEIFNSILEDIETEYELGID